MECGRRSSRSRSRGCHAAAGVRLSINNRKYFEVYGIPNGEGEGTEGEFEGTLTEPVEVCFPIPADIPPIQAYVLRFDEEGNRWVRTRGRQLKPGPPPVVCALLSEFSYFTVGGDRQSGALRGSLENPAPGSAQSGMSFQSGIGVISGWVCDAEQVEIVLNDDPPMLAAYGTERGDTAAACDDTNNGFGLLYNWNLLGDGEHEVVARVDGEELGRATVQVTTLGEDYVQDLEGEYPLEDFPSPGETVKVAWQEAQQNFRLFETTPAEQPAVGFPGGVLENPRPGSAQSGIGLISGWVCDAEKVEIVLNDDTDNPMLAAYGDRAGGHREGV